MHYKKFQREANVNIFLEFFSGYFLTESNITKPQTRFRNFYVVVEVSHETGRRVETGFTGGPLWYIASAQVVSIVIVIT